MTEQEMPVLALNHLLKRVLLSPTSKGRLKVLASSKLLTISVETQSFLSSSAVTEEHAEGFLLNLDLLEGD